MKTKLLLFILIIVNTLSAQVFTTGILETYRPEKLYYGSDVFMPANYKANDLKVNVSKQIYPSNWIYNLNNFKLAYSFSDNFENKFSYRQKTYEKDSTSRAYLDINEYEYSFGFHKHLPFKKQNQRALKAIELKRESINKARIAKGKTPKIFKEPTKTAFLFEANIGYGIANIYSNDTYAINNINSISYPRIDIFEIRLERLNFDACIYFLDRTGLSLSYNFRLALVNFKRIILEDIYPIELSTSFESYLPVFDFVNQNDPFLVYESNFKMAYEAKYFDLYFKINDVFGSNRALSEMNIEESIDFLKYSNIVYNLSLVAGISLNVSSIFNFN